MTDFSCGYSNIFVPLSKDIQLGSKSTLLAKTFGPPAYEIGSVRPSARPSFRPSFCLSASFLVIGSLVFSKT